MEIHSGVLLTTQATNCKVDRPTASFHPDIWGDRFLKAPDESQTKKIEDERMIQELVEEIRRELMSTAKTSMQQLQLIDSIQRLGIEYHFETEIEKALQTLYATYNVDHWIDYSDIYSAALSFRLLRQHGYKVPCNIFNKFKNVEGRFADFITQDVKGMLEFYEASHLSVHGEDILDEGLVFTTDNLNNQLSSPNQEDDILLIEQIVYALKQPYRRGITRLEERRYMSIYEQNMSHNKTLLKLAKLDFNKLQSLHRRELTELCRWWKHELDVPKKLSFARDRVVEGYFWILGVYYEPQYVVARKILGKVLAITSIIDDMYDAFGTFEELKVFTEAIERWSFKCLDQLPEYMKICYKALLELYDEIEEEMIVQGKIYRIDYAKEALKILTRAYFEEAEWREDNYTPTTKEYMDVATRSCGYRSLIITSFLGMGDVATKKHFQWALENPIVIRAAATICRLKDDIVGHEFEQERKHIASAVHCYMKDNNVTKEETINEFNKCIEAAWKDLNEGFLKPTEIPSPLLYRILNFARVMEVVYKEDDWYTHVSPEMQNYVRQILSDPVPL